MAHGRADLAYDFLTAYLEVSGDYDGLDVLRFYPSIAPSSAPKSRAIKAAQKSATDGHYALAPYLKTARDLVAPRGAAARHHARPLGQRQDTRDAGARSAACAPFECARISSANGCTASPRARIRAPPSAEGSTTRARPHAPTRGSPRSRPPRCATGSTRSSTRPSCAGPSATHFRGSRNSTARASRSSTA